MASIRCKYIKVVPQFISAEFMRDVREKYICCVKVPFMLNFPLIRKGGRPTL